MKSSVKVSSSQGFGGGGLRRAGIVFVSILIASILYIMVAEGVKRRFLAEKKVFFVGESWQNNRAESPSAADSGGSAVSGVRS